MGLLNFYVALNSYVGDKNLIRRLYLLRNTLLEIHTEGFANHNIPDRYIGDGTRHLTLPPHEMLNFRY
jgi:hypothetical protein